MSIMQTRVKKSAGMKSVFSYLDYREYLHDHYRENKKNHSYFSFRYIASKTGLDPSFYAKVIRQRQHISLKSLPRLVEFLSLTKREYDYFVLLFRYNRNRNPEQTKRLLENLFEQRKPRMHNLEKEKYQYFSTWYLPAIRELLNFYRFDGDFKKLGMRLNPPISEAKAKKAIRLLLKLGLLRTNGSECYELTDQFITTEEVWDSVAIQNFQKEMLRLARDSISTIARHKRETSTLTLSLSWDSFVAMKQRLQKVREEFLSLARNDHAPNDVFQVNFQIFPLSEKRMRQENL